MPSGNVLRALCAQLSKQLNIHTDSWLDMDVDMGEVWKTVQPRRRRAVLPTLDMARHMMDAFPRSATPLEMPGVVLMDQPETFCPSERFNDYLTLLDRLFPRLQFILSVGANSLDAFPSSFRKKCLPLPDEEKPQPKSRPVRLPDTLDFFGANPDPLIDELAGIMFTQNMKSMENYYRWVSRRYAETYGALHMGLVDTIFRYNQRHKKGEYIASLAGTKKG